jgi:hypothetical protein
MVAFVVNEQRRAHPLIPLSIFRIKGLAAADATQVIAWAGFYSMFFFVTLYMQNVLGYSPLVVMGAGLGLLYAGVQTAANAGVPEDQAGLAAALITASFQLGSALGLAVFSGIATSRTSQLLAAHTPPPEALTAGFQRALLVSALCLVAAGAVAHLGPAPDSGARLPTGGCQRLAIASRTAGATSCVHRFSVVSLMMSPGRSR